MEMSWCHNQGLLYKIVEDNTSYTDQKKRVKKTYECNGVCVLQYLAFTCGLVRGGLSDLGLKSVVTAEVAGMPACKKPWQPFSS